jgi:hypothetical protein
MAGSITPAAWPVAAAQRISATAASMSLGSSWKMPRRRTGAWLQKSASHRLCACRPAHLCSSVAASRGTPVRWARMSKNGGSVLGKMISALTPSASMFARRRSLSQFDVSLTSTHGITTPASHASNSSCQRASR